MPVIMRLEGGADGQPTPFDGQYLAEYDPERDGIDAEGNVMLCHIVVTPDPLKAKRYRNLEKLWLDWKRVSRREPMRPDGKPNRPLTYFTITTVTVVP